MTAPQVFPTGLGPLQLDNLDRIVKAQPGFVMLLVHQDSDIGWPHWADIVEVRQGAMMVAVDTTTDAELVVAAFRDRGLRFDMVAIRTGAGPALKAHADQDAGFATDLERELRTQRHVLQVVIFTSRSDVQARLTSAGTEVTDVLGMENLLRRTLAAAPARRRRRRQRT